jgi:hypothetical protein
VTNNKGVMVTKLVLVVVDKAAEIKVVTSLSLNNQILNHLRPHHLLRSHLLLVAHQKKQGVTLHLIMVVALLAVDL